MERLVRFDSADLQQIAISVFVGLALHSLIYLLLPNPRAVLQERYKGNEKPPKPLNKHECLNIFATLPFLMYFAAVGVYGMLETRSEFFTSGMEGARFRLLQRCEIARHLCNIMMGYQIFNITHSFIYNYATVGFTVHHFSVVLIGIFLHHPYANNYAHFFMGFSELSTITLAFYDLFKISPVLRQRFPTLNALIPGIFGVTFLAIRIVMWIPLCGMFWYDQITVHKMGGIPNYIVAGSFSFSNIVLTVLQLKWAALIVPRLVKVLTGRGPSASVKQQ